MTEPTDAIVRAPYYDGRGFPVDALSPKEFEEFIFGCLLCVEDILGLRITGKPSGSGDGGFDVQGEAIRSKRRACVQCKRQKAPLGTPQIAEELAKVGATMVIEGSDIGEHRFICTGGIRTKLRNLLRERPLRQLALEAGERLQTALDGELGSLRVRLEKMGVEPRQVAESYVLGLDILAVWGLDEFDAALSPRWSDVLKVAQRYFRVATVVQEHPRASFDRLAYTEEYRNFKVVIEPRIANSRLPDGITASSTADLSSTVDVYQRNIKSLNQLTELKPGELAVLVGDGGVGKSTALMLLRAEALRSNPDLTLPVLISLTNYVPGGLDRMIHQELGVDYGTWKSLPDDVLLLCDGLNECPSANIPAFLEELKPLLKRNEIACVLSTRESTRHKKVVLPQAPTVCVKIEGLTPIAIRRIAEHELKEAPIDAFVTAYRSLADDSGSPLLWTPFAVLVALRLWKRNAVLPATLGEMLQTLLYARCTRDAESPEQRPSPDVILRLAGALSFQSLFVDRRLECPVFEAGKCIREAKQLCADALGVADMHETQVVELLAHHELLHVSDGGHISFGHQLLAGALAAPVLSRIWRDHKDSLGEPIADDAWVFAARTIPQEHVEEFLQAAFDVDLMLGARIARELHSEFHDFAESLLARSVAADAPEIVQVQGMFAMARLGSFGAVSKLRNLAANTNSPTHHAAERALAASGDRDYLRKLLTVVDPMRSSGIQMSGGPISIWEASPLPTRLDLARQRLTECNAGEPVGESLSLLAYERDPNDATLVEKHLSGATSVVAWQSALYALHEISPARADEVLGETLSSMSAPGEKATLIRVATLIGLHVNLQEAFKCAVAEISSGESDREEELSLHQLISDVVSKSTLPSDLVAIVERELPVSSGDRRTRLWHIANGCRSNSIADYAEWTIEQWGADLGNACNYFIAQLDLARARRHRLIELCECGLENEQNWYGFVTWRVLTLIGELGFTVKTTCQLSAMIQRLARVQIAVENDDTISLSPKDAEVLKSTGPEHLRFHLGFLAAQLIPAAAKARMFLSDDVLVSLLYFDTHSNGVVIPLREALSSLSPSTIDHVLTQIKEPWTRLSALVAVCGLGLTDIRQDMMACELRRWYAFPAGLTRVGEAIEACWCKSVCEIVMTTVAEIPTWSESESQFFWSFFRLVSKRIGPDDQTFIEGKVPEARSAFARRILELWRDQAAGGRVGLGRLAVEGTSVAPHA